MKDYLISLLSVIIGTSLISITVVSGKFKSSIKVIISLIIVITLFQGFPNIKFDSFSIMSEDYSASIIDYSEIEIENTLNSLIEENIKTYFSVDNVFVDSDILIDDSNIRVLSVSVCVDTDVSLLYIWDYLRNNLQMSGEISVTRIKDEGIK